jgi:hypothetical protein
VRGVLLEHGAAPDGSQLVPFAEPGACRLVVPPMAAESSGGRGPGERRDSPKQ